MGGTSIFHFSCFPSLDALGTPGSPSFHALFQNPGVGSTKEKPAQTPRPRRLGRQGPTPLRLKRPGLQPLLPKFPRIQISIISSPAHAPPPCPPDLGQMFTVDFQILLLGLCWGWEKDWCLNSLTLRLKTRFLTPCHTLPAAVLLRAEDLVESPALRKLGASHSTEV